MIHDLDDDVSFGLLWAYSIFFSEPITARSTDYKLEYYGHMSSQIFETWILSDIALMI